jgi:hypothetical protein
MVAAKRRQIRVVLHELALSLQHLGRLLLRNCLGLLLGLLALLAHEDLLEVLGEDVNVAGEQGEEVGVVEVDVRVDGVFLLDVGHVHIHREGQVALQHGDGLGWVREGVLLSLGDSRSLWIDLKVFTSRSNFHSNYSWICVLIL